MIQGGEQAKRILSESIGKPMKVHISESGNHKKTFVISSGYIKDIIFQEETETMQAGFSIQLAYRNGKGYGHRENFFGNVEYFEFTERDWMSDNLRIQYKDGSYFNLEIIQPMDETELVD